ncbi:hypothetical protein TNCV_1020731 [Trichonephila clavipes]|uniref:Uncharacterized protein n=1 Tax=Trichonephila clavipes TaxID=2585209 RepID=A0A8X6SMS0_TRICX|nr:hypothetical protein TNCV_1020731 [Trichonephila clavipes]
MNEREVEVALTSAGELLRKKHPFSLQIVLHSVLSCLPESQLQWMLGLLVNSHCRVNWLRDENGPSLRIYPVPSECLVENRPVLMLNLERKFPSIPYTCWPNNNCKSVETLKRFSGEIYRFVLPVVDDK